MRGHRFAAVLMSVSGAACQTAPPEPTGECAADPEDDRFYPLQVGAWWRHGVTDANTGVPVCGDKTIAIEDLSPIPMRPDVTAYRAVRRTPTEIGVRWQEVRGEDIVRHVDEWFDLDMQRTKIRHYCPYQVRVSGGDSLGFTDEILQAEVTAVTPEAWSTCEAIVIDPTTCEPESVDPDCSVLVSTIVNEWTLEADGETATVPAGEFADVRTWRIHEEGSADQSYAWARGLGKVSELESGVEEERLVDCCLPSTGCTRPVPQDLEDGCP